MGDRMKILVLSGAWPFIGGSGRGVEVALYEILRLLAAENDFEVAFAPAGIEEPRLSPSAQVGIDELSRQGVRRLRWIRFDDTAPAPFLRRNARRLFGNDLIPGAGQQDRIVAVCRAENWTPDVVMPIWSDIATAAASGLPWPVLTYYGNPYDKVWLANLRLRWHWERRWRPSWLLRYATDRLLEMRIAREHIASMRRLAFVGDVHANDAERYRSVGVKARYVRSMWPRADHSDWVARRTAAEQLSPLKIAASVGSVPSTGNTFGLWALGAEILPALKRRGVARDGFELHVYGSGKPRPFIEPILRDPAIRLRGFVDDIDGEIYSCPIYIVANNRYFYKAGHNRFLHAWSLGACIVTWRDSALAMPELVHDKNVLLAESADEMAELVAAAAADENLRRRLGAAGRATVLELYRPDSMVAEMARQIRARRPGATIG
jgi:glycosyltransferase involved in cell wall biosynthesis